MKIFSLEQLTKSFFRELQNLAKNNFKGGGSRQVTEGVCKPSAFITVFLKTTFLIISTLCGKQFLHYNHCRQLFLRVDRQLSVCQRHSLTAEGFAGPTPTDQRQCVPLL